MTIVDFQRSDWTDDGTGGTAETTPSVSWQAGDLILVFGMTENTSGAGGTLSTPTGTGLTFSLITSFTSGGAPAWAWSATAGSSGSSAISTTRGLFGSHAICVYVIRGHGGIGNSSATRASTKVRSLTRSGDNSAVFQCAADWNAVNDVAVTASPAGGTVDAAVFDSGAATYFSLSWLDQGAAGSTSYGIADHTGTVDLTSIVVEVLAGEGGGGEELTLQIGDTISLSDGGVKEAGMTVSDGVSLGDGRSAAAGKGVSDALVLADALARVSGKVASDGLALGDGQSGILLLSLELADALGLTDGQLLSVIKGVSDDFAVSDGLAALSGKLVSDTISLGDASEGLIALVLQVIDSFSLSDEQSQAVGKALSEALEIADLCGKLAAKTGGDALSFADQVTGGFLKELALSDGFSLEDVAAVELVLSQIVRALRYPLTALALDDDLGAVELNDELGVVEINDELTAVEVRAALAN